MMIWNRCTADIIFYDERRAATNEEGYIVRLSDQTIEVAYDDDEGAVCYRGKNNGNGHYELRAPERHGEASLHAIQDGHIMEGYWKEGESRGMWRIRLI